MTHIVFEAEPGASSANPLTIPKPVGRMMVLMALGAIAVAGWYSLRGETAEVAPLAPVVAARMLSFADAADGGLRVTDATTNSPVLTVDAKDATFLRALVRAVHGGRAEDATAAGTVALLELRQDGQMTVRNQATGAVASANAFGQTQASRLVALMAARDSAGR